MEQFPKNIPHDLKLLLKRFWPGPLTVVYKGLAYRMPANPILLKIAQHLGPLYGTSANISGEKPIKDLSEANIVFKEHIDKFMVVRSGCVCSGVFSTIYDYDKKEIIREGEIPKWKIFN